MSCISMTVANSEMKSEYVIYLCICVQVCLGMCVPDVVDLVPVSNVQCEIWQNVRLDSMQWKFRAPHTDRGSLTKSPTTLYCFVCQARVLPHSIKAYRGVHTHTHTNAETHLQCHTAIHPLKQSQLAKNSSPCSTASLGSRPAHAVGP